MRGFPSTGWARGLLGRLVAQAATGLAVAGPTLVVLVAAIMSERVRAPNEGEPDSTRLGTG